MPARCSPHRRANFLPCLCPTPAFSACCCMGSALRVLEVRLAYAHEDFEFDQLEKLCKKDMSEANVRLMRSYAKASFAAGTADVSMDDDRKAGSGDQPEVASE